ncbi:MAG: hypothetical protein ACXWEY_16230 [Bacteroidia bacterium]
MKPTKSGQIVKFHTPLEGENPKQLYVLLELHEDVERPRAQIKALNTNLSFPVISTVLLNELEVVEIDTTELVGHKVTIDKSDYSQETGIVVNVSKQEILHDLTKGVKGIESNVWLTIRDASGKQHTGMLLVK